MNCNIQKVIYVDIELSTENIKNFNLIEKI